MVMHTLRCTVVVVQDCGQTIEQGMVELAGTDVDAEDGGENEMKEKMKHCCYVAFMRQAIVGVLIEYCNATGRLAQL